MPVLIVFLALVGLAIGSFLNVVVYRLPRGESLATPPSRCPTCETPIRPWHNVPVLGWLILRGRCAQCHASISVRYPAVELLTAAVFVAVTLRADQLRLLPALPALLYFAAAGITLAFIDLDTRRLPNAIVLPSYPILAVLLGGAAWWQHAWLALARAGAGSIALFGFYFLLVWLYPAGMGFGDAKLAGVLGGVMAYVSWSTLLIGAFAGFLFGAVVGIGLLASGRGTRKTAVPFGPFMIAGALTAILLATGSA
ncbi:MAG: leader peptidase (prepilin peptidase) / N-methyltransferase [Mycobacterium sp.]|nr:leader peptidase (prepilin peptidase) / N-methyltransferase [Mycobacterium sp.]